MIFVKCVFLNVLAFGPFISIKGPKELKPNPSILTVTFCTSTKSGLDNTTWSPIDKLMFSYKYILSVSTDFMRCVVGTL